MKSFKLPIILLVLATASACGRSAADSQQLGGTASTESREAPMKVGVALGMVQSRPLRVGIAVDKTGSAEPNGVSIAKPEDFSVLVDVLRERGGELAVGLIRENSNRPLLRLRLDPPPVKRQLDNESNPYSRAEMEANQKQEDQERRIKIDLSISEFLNSLKELMATPADSKKTAICEAIQRVDLFLQEDEMPWGQIAKYAVFITDGQENVNKLPCTPMRANARILLVKGVGSKGVFEGWDTLLFEEPTAALSWIISSQRGAS